jgi:hypothetical protein
MRFFASFITCFLCFFQGIAQYKQHQPFREYYTAHAVGSERVHQRLYLGFGKHLVSGSFSLQYTANDTLGNSITVSAEQKLSASHSVVVHAGSFFPIALMGESSMLALNIELLFSYAEFAYDSIVIHPDIVYKKRVPYLIAGIPLSLDFKTGGDVSLSKKSKQMFAAGLGVTPCISTPAAINRKTQSSPPLTAVPFVKLEVGAFVGLAFKLRAVAYLRGGINVRKTEKNIYFPPDDLSLKVQSGYGYQLSLIVMPFSYSWSNDI